MKPLDSNKIYLAFCYNCKSLKPFEAYINNHLSEKTFTKASLKCLSCKRFRKMDYSFDKLNYLKTIEVKKDV